MTIAGRAAAVAFAAVLCASFAAGSAGGAAAAEKPRSRCSHAVVFTLPGVTWSAVEEWRPPALERAVAAGAIGSVSVRTNSSRTSLVSGFATIGAGTRVNAFFTAGIPVSTRYNGPVFQRRVKVSGVDEIETLAASAGYSTARPGALASALDPLPVIPVGNADPGLPPPSPAGLGRYALLAAMDSAGRVERAATGPGLLRRDASAPFGARTDARAISTAVDRALEIPCSTLIVDQGDLVRADRWTNTTLQPEVEARRGALLAADALLGHILDALDPERDLLLVVSPTSPAWDRTIHFGVAVAVGPGWHRGSALQSPTTRRKGIVTLTDLAPTVLAHHDVERPRSMLGRAWFPGGPAPEDPIDAAVELDRESVFVDRMRTPVSTGFVLFQLLLYVATVWVLYRRDRRDPRVEGGPLLSSLLIGALALAAFPVATYLCGLLTGHALGEAGYVVALLAVDAAVVGMVMVAVANPLDRLLGIAAFTLVVLVVDLFVGAPLQLNTVFSYSPIVAGRFAGIGNIAFAVLAAAAVLTGTLIVERGRSKRRALALTAGLFAVTVVVDGAPQLGSDVGGAIALVPGLAITWLLLSGRRVSWRIAAVSAVAAVVVLAAFLALDLSRPSQEQTHLARLFEEMRSGGGTVFFDTVGRKISTNLRVFRSTIWTFVVPPALALLVWLLMWPRGRWDRLASTFPPVRAGLLGGLLLAVLGFAVNDSGIVVPAMMLSYLVPVALVTHLSLDSGTETS